MAFSFTRVVDPLLKSDGVQHHCYTEACTALFVPDTKDASRGQIGKAMSDNREIRSQLAGSIAARDVVFFKRYEMRGSSRSPLGKLYIGVELNGFFYKISLIGIGGDGARLQRMLQFAGLAAPKPPLYKATSIRTSKWAAGGAAPSAALGGSMGSSSGSVVGGYQNAGQASAPAQPFVHVINGSDQDDQDIEDAIYSNVSQVIYSNGA